MATDPLPGAARSLWIEDPEGLGAPPLSEDAEADVCVVGAGIAGVTTALELQRAGRSVVLLDMHRVGAGVTGHSTAKLSALQGTVYSELERRFGRDGAASYAALNQGAIAYITAQVHALKIDAGLRERPHAVFAWDESQMGQIEQEAQAAERAGLPVRLTGDLGLPFPIAGAVVLDRQAEIQIHRYVLALARAFAAAGGRVHEDTTVTHVSPFPPTSSPVVTTEGGARVRARDVVVATHYPFLDRGLYFARLSPKRSYAIAVRGASPLPDVMCISLSSPTRSLRLAPDPERVGEELLVVGGEGHDAGEQGDRTGERYRALADFAREQFGAAEVTHRWSAHDMTTADGLPYAGPLTPVSRHVWVTSGFRKWGLTNGTAAGRILAGRILGEPLEHGELFDTARLTPVRSAPGMVREGVKDGLHFFGDRMRRPDGGEDELTALEPGGEGKLLKVGGQLVAASRDEDGTTHCVSPVCTHLGCRVGWNTAERSWDCPCHGSRFAPDGTVLTGPATAPLPVQEAVRGQTGS